MTRRRVIKRYSGEFGFFELVKRAEFAIANLRTLLSCAVPKKSVECQTLAMRSECPIWVKSRHMQCTSAINIACRGPIRIEPVNSVRQQAAEFSEGSARIAGREAEASCQRYDLCTIDVRKGIRHHDQAAIRRESLCGNDRFDSGYILDRGCDRLHNQGRSGSFEGVQVRFGIWRHGRVEQHRDSDNARRNLLE